MTRQKLTGVKRRQVSDDDMSNGPPKKTSKTSDEPEEINFACSGGAGRREKTADFITKCKRKEVTPYQTIWDKQQYLLDHPKDDKHGFRESIKNDTSRICEVYTPCKRKSGILKCFFLV